MPVYAHGDEKRACSILGTGASFKVGACPRCSYASNTENALAKQETLAEVTVSPIDTMQICSIVLTVCFEPLFTSREMKTTFASLAYFLTPPSRGGLIWDRLGYIRHSTRAAIQVTRLETR